MNSRSFPYWRAIALPLFAMTLFGQGCFFTTTTQSADGGVWKTKDRGKEWANKRALIDGPKISAGAASFTTVNMVLDPEDANAIYLATDQHGLVYSLDAGDSWQRVTNLRGPRINAVAVDGKSKCIVYAAARNEIWKTQNCMRDWSRIYFDPRVETQITRIAVDWYNPQIVYAGTSQGDVLKSINAGGAWKQVLHVEGTNINQFVLDPKDSRVVYAATNGEGFFRSVDGGSTWEQVRKQFGDTFDEARRVTHLVIDPKTPSTLYVVSKYGIIKSVDRGETWGALKLTGAPDTIKINALAIDPTDSRKMVYTGPTTISYTADGGTTWTAKKLPTTRGGNSLLIDPRDGNTIYLGTYPLPQ